MLLSLSDAPAAQRGTENVQSQQEERFQRKHLLLAYKYNTVHVYCPEHHN